MIPSQTQIDSIPLARGTEFQMTEKEMKTFRSRIYSINKEGIRKYRTVRCMDYLMVWRIE